MLLLLSILLFIFLFTASLSSSFGQAHAEQLSSLQVTSIVGSVITSLLIIAGIFLHWYI